MSADTARARDGSRLAEKQSIEPSVFQSALTQDIAESLDQAKPHSTHALAQAASGPLLMTETLSELESIPDVPFDQLCNDGSKITPKNILGKIMRFALTPIKEVYLPLMTWGLPTNFLMVCVTQNLYMLDSQQQQEVLRTDRQGDSVSLMCVPAVSQVAVGMKAEPTAHAEHDVADHVGVSDLQQTLPHAWVHRADGCVVITKGELKTCPTTCVLPL